MTDLNPNTRCTLGYNLETNSFNLSCSCLVDWIGIRIGGFPRFYRSICALIIGLNNLSTYACRNGHNDLVITYMVFWASQLEDFNLYSNPNLLPKLNNSIDVSLTAFVSQHPVDRVRIEVEWHLGLLDR